MLELFVDLYHQGGFVMPFLLASLAVIWYGLGYRMVTVRRGSRLPLKELVQRAEQGDLPKEGLMPTLAAEGLVLAKRSRKHLHHRLEAAFAPYVDDLKSHADLVRLLVMVAPLAGLLGTVTGMIETFDSLASMAMFTQGGGIAAGISEALVSTQTGLFVAVPGLILGGLLTARQNRLQDEIEELKELLCMHADRGVA